MRRFNQYTKQTKQTKHTKHKTQNQRRHPRAANTRTGSNQFVQRLALERGKHLVEVGLVDGDAHLGLQARDVGLGRVLISTEDNQQIGRNVTHLEGGRCKEWTDF